MSKQDERAVPIPLDQTGSALEGLFVSGGEGSAAGAVIAPPHPLYGGSMDSPVTSELAWACAKAGIASLRFNWRGVGGSSGSPSGKWSDADEDYAATLRQIAESVPGELIACGYSFGAAAAVRVGVAEPRVRALLLVAPPSGLLDGPALSSFDGRVLLVTGQLDTLAPPRALKELAGRLPAARFEVLPDTDHFFGAGLADLSKIAYEFLQP